MKAMEITNCFLIGFEACSTGSDFMPVFTVILVLKPMVGWGKSQHETCNCCFAKR